MAAPDAPEEVLRDLLSSERRLRSLVAATAHFVWLARPDGALMSDMPLWREITGQSREEVIGAGWLDAIHPEDRERVGATWAEAVRTGGIYRTSYRIRRAAGGWAWLEVNGAPVLDDDGTVAEYIGQCTDVTDRKELELRVARERRLLERVVEESDIGTGLLWGPDLVYLLINRAGQRLLPPDREVVGRALAEVLPEVPQEIVDLLHEVRESGTARELPDSELPFGGPEELGGMRFYASRAVPVTDEHGEVGGVLTLAVERTEEVRRQRALEARAASDRRVADALQAAIAADLPPEHPGFDLAARLRPAGSDLAVGGDWYDAIPLGSGRMALVIADVAGRGLPAATTMGQARAVLRAALLQPGATAAGALAGLERFVEALPHDDAMLTALVAIADPSAGTLTLSRAGHPPGVLRRASGEVLLLDGSRGAPVGAGGPRPAEVEVELGPGDLVIVFTDGLVERPGGDLGAAIDLVAQDVAAHGEDPLDALADRLLEAAGPAYDDVALLLARVSG